MKVTERLKDNRIFKNRKTGDWGTLRGSFERVAREALTFGAYIFAAQFTQRVGHKFGGDPLAPSHVEIGVVEGFGDASRECSGFCDILRLFNSRREL